MIFYHYVSDTLEPALIILKCMVNEHVFMNLIHRVKSLALTNLEVWKNCMCFGNTYHSDFWDNHCELYSAYYFKGFMLD